MDALFQGMGGKKGEVVKARRESTSESPNLPLCLCYRESHFAFRNLHVLLPLDSITQTRDLLLQI